MKARIKLDTGNTYTELYAVEGGVYFTPDDTVIGCAPWLLIKDDGKVEVLFNGVHRKSNHTYEVIGGK